MRFGFLGGSFNPPHWGHVAMARYALDQNGVDHIVVVPCAAHPYAKPLAAFADRLDMCGAAFADLAPAVEVSDCEAQLPAPTYTITTIRHLQHQHVGDWVLLLGSDQATDVANWHDSVALQKIAPVVVIPRGQLAEIPNVSATEIRERCKTGEDISTLVPNAVADYIQRHTLYRK